MRDNEIENAQIESTSLGMEDHGIPTCWIHTKQGATAQGFGGYSLNHYGIAFLIGVCRAVGVRTWEELPGKYIRIKRRDGLICAIGHIVEDKWYEPERDA